MMKGKESLRELLRVRGEQARAGNAIYTPQFFRLHSPGGKAALEALLEQNPFLKVYDQLNGQLGELVRSMHPERKLKEEEVQAMVKEHTGDMPPEEYGVWVYYPWHDKLVHILDEKEFVEMRTNRNQYKITREERDLLATKKIGVVGLSVGQSVSLALSMERAYGELRIADMDELEITNLNRLRSGVYNLGLRKTVLVAREIAEIDPFLKVVCFHEGITEENIDSFLCDQGKLDMLIDECDGLDIKILCRIRAKQFRIPVVMEASDRATVDVERFDLEPGRSILHGYIDHLDVSKVKYLKTSEEKVPYILPIAGVETLSSRMKASMIEVGETISTWPQLASAVSMGGGITADVCRRILLDQFHQSGRYFVDVEEQIGDNKPERKVEAEEIPALGAEKMEEYIRKTGLAPLPGQLSPPEHLIKEIVNAAAWAPSAGNNQPWKWYFDGFQLWLFHERKRSASYGDFRNIASYVALGAALENAGLKAAELGISWKEELFPLKNSRANPVAVFRFFKADGDLPRPDELSNYINQRHTNRGLGIGGKIPVPALEEITASVLEIPGAGFHYVEDPDKIGQLARILGAAERYRIFIPEGHHDLFERELRWSPEDAKATGDGIDLATFSLTPTEYIGLRLARNPEAIELLGEWDAGTALEKLTRKAVKSSSAVGLITMPSFSAESFILGGKAVERMWLTATKNNISIQPLLAALLHFARLHQGKGEKMPEKIRKNFEQLYEGYSRIFGTQRNNRTDVFLFRLCISEVPKVKSYRLNREEVYFSRD